MNGRFASRYGRAFGEILFLRPRSENISSLNLFARISLYALALILYYIPIFHYTVRRCVAEHELIPYLLAVVAVHILAKVMLYNSKRVQKRFSTVKSRKNFLLRVWLVVEYVVFMWLVYLFYPLTCVLAPVSLLGMSVESMLGYSFIANLFLQSPEQFIMLGGIASYILFILADGYRKLKTGFLPDYLGLYALLAILSAAAERGINRVFEFLKVDISDVTSVLSEIFSLSNRSMNIVASVMTAVFAVYSLYTNCGSPAAKNPDEAALAEAPPAGGVITVDDDEY